MFIAKMSVDFSEIISFKMINFTFEMILIFNDCYYKPIPFLLSIRREDNLYYIIFIQLNNEKNILPRKCN